MLFSASSMACTCTMPNTVQRWIVSTACATGRPGAPIASRSLPVASTMLSLMDIGIGSACTWSSFTWIDADDAVLDVHARADVVQLEARLGGPQRLAIIVQAPAGHERAVADGHFGRTSPVALPRSRSRLCLILCARRLCYSLTLDVTARPVISSPSSVKRLPGVDRHAERVGLIGLPVEQADDRPGRDWPRAVAGSDLASASMLIGSTYTPLSASSITASGGLSFCHCRSASPMRLKRSPLADAIERAALRLHERADRIRRRRCRR